MTEIFGLLILAVTAILAAYYDVRVQRGEDC